MNLIQFLLIALNKNNIGIKMNMKHNFIMLVFKIELLCIQYNKNLKNRRSQFNKKNKFS